jgi:hypothetical protein
MGLPSEDADPSATKKSRMVPLIRQAALLRVRMILAKIDDALAKDDLDGVSSLLREIAAALDETGVRRRIVPEVADTEDAPDPKLPA